MLSSDDVKKRYEQKAAVEKQKYEARLAEYKKSGGGDAAKAGKGAAKAAPSKKPAKKPAGKKAAKAKSSDEEDDDDDEDED